MGIQEKVEGEDKAPFTLRSTLDKPVVCFAVRLEALLRVRPFIGVEAMRYYLNGVFVSSHADGGAVCVATDGRRMGVRIDRSGLVNEPQIVNLPAALKKPGKLTPNPWAVLTRTGPVYGHLSLVESIHDKKHDTAENAIARVEDCYQRFGDVLIDGTFPDYTRLIPKAGPTDTARAFNSDHFSSFGNYLTIRGENEGAPHLVLDNNDPDFVGVIMPMRVQAKDAQDWVSRLEYPGAA